MSVQICGTDIPIDLAYLEIFLSSFVFIMLALASLTAIALTIYIISPLFSYMEHKRLIFINRLFQERRKLEEIERQKRYDYPR